MAWTYTQNFNSLNTGLLPGQDSWVSLQGSGQNVVTSPTFEGAKAYECASGVDSDIRRQLDSTITTGIAQVHFAIKESGTVGGINVQFQGSNGSMATRFIFTGGNLIMSTGSGAITIITSFVSNQWYEIFCYLDIDNKQVKARVDSGNYTSLYGWYDVATDIKWLYVGYGGAGSPTGGLDDIRPYTDTLLPSVSDSTTVSENIQLTILDIISVSDSTTVSENIQLVVLNLPSVSDSTTVSENIQLTILESLSVSDSITTSESITILIPTLVPSVSDITTVSESVTVFIPILVPSVFDSVTTSESVTVFIPILVSSASDSTTVSENIQLTILDIISVSDSTTVSENIQLVVFDFPSVSDSTTTSESVTILIPILVPSVSDLTTVSENIQLTVFEFPSVFDSIIVSESVTILIPILVPSVFDSITTSESVTVFIPILVPSVSDSTTVSDVINDYEANLVPLVFDLITVSDTYSFDAPIFGINLPENRPIGDTGDGDTWGLQTIDTYPSSVAGDMGIWGGEY